MGLQSSINDLWSLMSSLSFFQKWQDSGLLFFQVCSSQYFVSTQTSNRFSNFVSWTSSLRPPRLFDVFIRRKLFILYFTISFRAWYEQSWYRMSDYAFTACFVVIMGPNNIFAAFIRATCGFGPFKISQITVEFSTVWIFTYLILR